MTTGEQASLAEIATWLRDSTDELAQRQLQLLRTSFPSYARIPDEELLRSAARNVVRVAETIEGQDELPVGVLEDEATSAQYRALQGIPADEVSSAYRAVLAVVRDACLARAAARGVPVEAILAATQRLWAMTDRLSDRVTSARRDIELEMVRREERQRLGFLHRLLVGSLLPSEMVHVGSAYGLDGDRQYWVFRGRGATPDPHALTRQLERSCTDPRFPPLIGSVEADVAGVAGRRPSTSDELGLVATIGPVPLAEISHAWAEATRLLSVAAKYDRRGVVDSESLSIRIAVVQESELGDALYNRYVARVLAQSRIGELLLESVRVLLAEKRFVPAAAQVLNVHTNTLRYRIEKFEELTGADLTDTETIIKVWWALEYWQVHRRHD